MSDAALVPPDESYGQRLARRFRRDSFAVAGLGFVIVAFVIAAFAPFIANNHALIRVADGHLSFPVFRSLQPIEWRFLVFVPLAGLIYAVRRPLFFRPGRGLAIVAGVVVLIQVVIMQLHPYNDVTNDRTRPASFKLMPPIPWSPIETSSDQLVGPDWKHLCGTDSTGRDVAARLLHGARTSLAIGFVAQGIALGVGVSLGAVAGYYRRWVDIVICRFIEIMECFPSLLLILVIIGLSDAQNNMIVIMTVIGLTGWTGTARLVRGEFLRLGGQTFPQAARALGAGDLRIILGHLLPNSLGPILVTATFGVASTILLESSLSFLGFGMQAPTPSWGDLISEGRKYIDFAWWLAFFPGVVMLLTIMSYNFVGEGLRDAVDPRLRVK
jgi:peptide/nickel transport system permease protein